MSERQQRAVYAALERVFRHYNDEVGPRDEDRRTHDFVFHMTDWNDDLVRLARVYANPTAHSQAEWNDAVAGFLYHAVGHLLAAAKLNDMLLDPFRVISAKKRPSGKRKPAAAR